jgi:rhamnogalacturonyl hydrolase YesR
MSNSEANQDFCSDMPKLNPLFLTASLLLAMLCIPTSAQTPATRDDILREAAKVADAQLQTIGEKTNLDWTWGVMAAGYFEFSRVAPDGTKYTDAMQQIAEKSHWTPLLHARLPFHADDFCMMQTFLDLYALHPQPEHLKAIQTRMDAAAEHLSSTATPAKLTYTWCDALFMAPPALARMSVVTKDLRYLNAADAEFWRTTALLYDKDEHLFYRDARFLSMKSAKGTKIFWSRGNAWVLAGLARLMQAMPTDYPTRRKYETLFREMAGKIITLQSPDGTWHASLEDPADFPASETSGTSLFTYAIAWGINNHLLDRDTALPVVEKSWAVLLKARQPDGLPGYSQAASDRPGYARINSYQPYTIGGYLLAATELSKLAPLTLPEVALVDPKIPATNPTTQPIEPAPDAIAFARYVPERMDDIAWENDRIAHRIYGPALQHNPKEHSGSGIDVWVKSVREPVINEWYKSKKYHINRGTGLDFYEVGTSRGDGGLGIWDDGKLFCSKDWVTEKILDLGKDECGFTITYDPWDANGRKVWETRTMTLKAGSNLTRIESTLDSDKPGDLIVGIGLCSERPGKGGRVLRDKELGVMSFWQPPEKDGTIGVGVVVDPKTIVDFTQDPKDYLVLIKATPGKPFVYYAGACWDKGLDFHTADEWEKYLKEFKPE